MKKMYYILFALAVIASASACSKDYAADAFGERSHSDDPVQTYMLHIADELITDNLLELESALAADATAGIARFYYNTDGKSISEDGAVWTVLRDGSLYGVEIAKVAGQDAWTMSGKMDFSFDYDTYPTEYTMTIVAADQSVAPHRSWNVGITGTRTESGGYRCEFHSEAEIQYQALTENEYWNAYGYLMMTVYKNDKQVDKLILELKGGKSTASIAHIK